MDIKSERLKYIKENIDSIKYEYGLDNLTLFDHRLNVLISRLRPNNHYDNTLEIKDYLLLGYQLIENKIYECKQLNPESYREIVELKELKEYINLDKQQEFIYTILNNTRHTVAHRIDYIIFYSRQYDMNIHNFEFYYMDPRTFELITFNILFHNEIKNIITNISRPETKMINIISINKMGEYKTDFKCKYTIGLKENIIYNIKSDHLSKKDWEKATLIDKSKLTHIIWKNPFDINSYKKINYKNKLTIIDKSYKLYDNQKVEISEVKDTKLFMKFIYEYINKQITSDDFIDKCILNFGKNILKHFVGNMTKDNINIYNKLFDSCTKYECIENLIYYYFNTDDISKPQMNTLLNSYLYNLNKKVNDIKIKELFDILQNNTNTMKIRYIFEYIKNANYRLNFIPDGNLRDLSIIYDILNIKFYDENLYRQIIYPIVDCLYHNNIIYNRDIDIFLILYKYNCIRECKLDKRTKIRIKFEFENPNYKLRFIRCLTIIEKNFSVDFSKKTRKDINKVVKLLINNLIEYIKIEINDLNKISEIKELFSTIKDEELILILIDKRLVKYKNDITKLI